MSIQKADNVMWRAQIESPNITGTGFFRSHVETVIDDPNDADLPLTSNRRDVAAIPFTEGCKALEVELESGKKLTLGELLEATRLFSTLAVARERDIEA